MIKRLITGIILCAVLIPLLVIDVLFPVLQVVAGLFVVVGIYEMLKLFGKDKVYSWGVQLLIYIAGVLVYCSGLTFGAKGNMALGMSFILIATILLLSLLVFSKSFDAKDISKTIFSVFYVGLGVASIIALREIGINVVIYLFLITVMTDVFAYVYGMLFGKHQMIARISPKKTWEGSVGGTIIATVTAGLFAFLYPSLFGGAGVFEVLETGYNLTPVWQGVIIFGTTFIASIVSQIGDLVASRLKRTYDIKDFGNIFPGHGGFLDRFDSSILTAMFILAIFLILNAFVSVPQVQVLTMFLGM